MLDSKKLNALGIPNEKTIMPLAMRLANTALAKGADEEQICKALQTLSATPAAMLDDPALGELARALQNYFLDGGAFVPRSTPAPWRRWGEGDMEEAAVRQMEYACLLPNAVRGALMPDAHTGYGLPIGGVLAVEDAVIPYAVGVDIACRMRLSVLDMPVSTLDERREIFVDALERQTRFGVGASFTIHERRNHAVMDADWNICKQAGATKDKAWKQLGTSGSGNHFVEFGELHLAKPAVLGGRALDAGVYLALLSHSGSRGSGEAVATYYSQLAMSLRPDMPQELRHLAWLSLHSEAGQEYWAAMELMGRYASANHELIHKHVLEHLGATALTHVENHHNFAWREVHDGREVVVHRKGATPAGLGMQGIVPGSMASPGFVVRGLGDKASLESCSHGAGRRMSRAAAFKTLTWEHMRACLQANNVELLSGGLDESPAVYKDIHEIMAVQANLVEILARFEPRLVKMAPEQQKRHYGKTSIEGNM